MQNLNGKRSPEETGLENEPNATNNIQNCYYCENSSCSCSNGKDYINRLVKLITEEVINRLGG